MEKTFDMTWEHYFKIVHNVYDSPKFKAAIKSMSSFYPLSDNDSILASMLAEHTGLAVVSIPNKHSIIVANVVDTGKSIEQYSKTPKVVLVSRIKIDVLNQYQQSNLYVKFPWEDIDKNLLDTIRYIISTVGGDTSKLDHIPHRLVLLFDTLFNGYNTVISVKRHSTKNKTIISTKHKFFSIGDEYGLPIYGTVHIAYCPSIYVLENPETLVDFCSHSITNPNKLADDIGTTIQKRIKPKGIIVKITAVDTYKKYLKERGNVKAMATRGDITLLWKVI